MVERALIWLRGSLSFRLILKAAEFARRSLTYKIILRIGSIIAGSRILQGISCFFRKPFNPEYSHCFRMLGKLDDSTRPVRSKTAAVARSSATSRILKNSKAFGLLTRYLIPSSAFFVFIDELGRDLFGSDSFFGYWDEAYLLASILFLFASWFAKAPEKPPISTPLDAPIFLLIAVSFFLYAVRPFHPEIGFEGMRVVAEFILWFYVFSRFLDTDGKARSFIRNLVRTGGILGFHGIIQAVVGVYSPANWTDAAEGTESTRVYSIVGSPNILGSIMALIIPIALAWAFQRSMERGRRALYLALTAGMCICLILTLSRGAWIGMAVGLVIFCIACNPRLLAGLVLAEGLTLLIPSVSNRITYMLSPQYIRSSLTGGRLLRYQIGWRMFKDNLLFGVGLGHFGGAVAMNHKDIFPDTFYMDNYWLKTAVEMGLFGLSAFFIVTAFLIVWSVRAINNVKDRDKRLIVVGGFSGLMGVIVHNFMENVFEVPYMVIYFWLVAAIVLYFGFRSPEARVSGTSVQKS